MLYRRSRTKWLDGEVENFSGIGLIDTVGNVVAEGSMEFIEADESLQVFWWHFVVQLGDRLYRKAALLR
jgi:hypothetical protein